MKVDEEIETEIPDVSGWFLDDIPTDGLKDPFLELLMAQVERPRFNLGGSGPPGRAD